MLTLTESASTVVKAIVSRRGEPEEGGLRIEAENAEATQFSVAIVPSPEATDAVVEQEGAHVFLGEKAAVALGDMTLDASVSDDGRVAFDILPQQP